MKLFEELRRRGLVAQCTNEEETERLLNEEKVLFYIGFDATADSLHVGHFLQLMIIRRLQMAGHMPILLLGTGTTMVGDPTGKTDMRKMLTVEEINYNADCFVEQMSRYIEIGEEGTQARVVRNGDWLLKIGYLEMLREVGVHFSVNRMLTAECFKSRMEKGLSFLEFNYMIMQSYDFLHLFRETGCKMELGGDDQWSNIINGVDLVRRVEGKEVFGLTFTLLANKDGSKMGKTEKGAVWLNREKTPPYEFFQYWRNVDDAMVIKCLKMLTFVPIEEIEEMERGLGDGASYNTAKERLAFELTKLVHSEQDAEEALEAARALFSGGGDAAAMPETVLSEADFTGGAIAVLDLLVKTGLAPSKGEARRLVQQGGISIGEDKITDIAAEIHRGDISGGLILRKGKKVFHRVNVE